MAKTNLEQTYELKKVGKQWLIGGAGKRFKRCPVLASAKEVDLFENYLTADDIIYEIQEDEAGEVILVKVEDTPVFEKRRVIEDDLENANLQRNVVAVKHGDTSGQQVAFPKEPNTKEKKNTKINNNTEQKPSEFTTSNDKQINKQTEKLVSPEAKTSFPVTIIYENQTSSENNEEKDSDDSNKSDNCIGKSNSQNEENENAPNQSFSDNTAGETPKEIEGDKTNDIDELEMGQTEDDYHSLDAGQTEETSMIETIFIMDVTETSVSKGAAADDGATSDIKDEIKLMNETVWEVISTRHSAELGQLKATFLEFKYTNGTLFVTAAGNSDESEQRLRRLRSFIEKFNNKEYEEILVESSDVVPTWCDEIEKTLTCECCMYVPGQKKVVMYCNTYEDCLKVKHLLLLKSGRIKASGMNNSRRKIHPPSETESLAENPCNARLVSEKKVTNKSEKCSKTNDSYLSFNSSEHTLNTNSEEGTKLEKTADDKERNDKTDIEHRLLWGKDKEYLKSFTTNENLKVYIYQAGILNLDVDCIVSASNQNLSHGGGIAAVIARAAGVALTREGDDYIKKYGSIPVGSACSTTAGKLPYKYVIHAVGPAWSDYRPYTEELVKRCETDLYNALYHSFLEAEKRGAKSVAFPAISSGIFGVPEDMCVYLYSKAIIEYSRKLVGLSNSLSEIHFVDKNVRILQQVCKVFQALSLSGRIAEYDRSKFVKYVATSANVKALQNESQGKSTPLNNSANKKPLQNESHVNSIQLNNLKLVKEGTFSWSVDARNVQMYKASEMLQVYVYNANILKLPVDCIVNAANESLQHGGGVAAVIARAAGRSLTEEGNTYIRKYGLIPTGQTCVTTAGNLPYHCVIHAPGPNWYDYRPHTIVDVRRCENDLYTAVYNSFLQAEKRKLRSIALPAISSAIFGVPIELCVQQYVKAAVNYSSQSEGRSHVLSEIHFIDKNPIIVKRIQEAFDIIVVKRRQYPYDTSMFATKT